MAEDKVVIYERGKPEVERRIDPKILELVILDDLQVSLNKVTEHLKKSEFKGQVDPRDLSVTDEIQELDLIKEWPFEPWITASFFNDGPNTAYIAINHFFAKWIELGNGESTNINFAKSDKRIRFINYKCDAGKTASVRVVGKY